MTLSLRPARDVMRLERLGSLHQTRLSFMRQMTRRMVAEAWSFTRTTFAIDAKGVGHAVYTAQGPERAYSLVAFAHDLPDEQRSDRVIAEAWDATFALFDGIPGDDDIQRLSQNVPVQEAGRVSQQELVLSRANRSARLWRHVVTRLAAGQQPDRQMLGDVGYLMRTTAVYGSGKFGAADRSRIAHRTECQAPFQVEMLTVYLIRWFVRDLVEHHARVEGGTKAVRLDPEIAEAVGVGNSTGLGMAPFLINHPRLLNNWITARETAIARVRALPRANTDEVGLFRDVLVRTRVLVDDWQSSHALQATRIDALSDDLALAANEPWGDLTKIDRPWDAVLTYAAETFSTDTQECLASLILEPHAELVDDLAVTMADTNDRTPIDGARSVGDMLRALKALHGPALDEDWSDPQLCARIWYVSEEKLEPRLGERFEEPLDDYEQPLGTARDAARAASALRSVPKDQSVAQFLLRYPEHRHVIRRAQIGETAPYAEIAGNVLSADLMPIDMLRAKLSFFGATRFDPRSDRWVRICMYAGAPYPPDLTADTADFWVYPRVPQ